MSTLPTRHRRRRTRLARSLTIVLAILLPVLAQAQTSRAEMEQRLHNPAMEYQIGQMYYSGKGSLNGSGVERDYAKALEHFRKAARYGSTDAVFSIGFMYYQGAGVAQDYAEALKWLTQAAAVHNGPAQLLLGRMHQYGEGVPKDTQKAIEWYKKEAVFESDMAEYALASVYLQGVHTPAPRGPGSRIMAVAGNPATGKPEIDIRFYPRLVDADIAEAEKWLLKAARRQNFDAMYTLASVYHEFQGDDPGKRQHMISLLKNLSLRGRADAQVLLGILHFNGKLIEEDQAKARQLFEAARRQGNDDASVLLDMLATLKP